MAGQSVRFEGYGPGDTAIVVECVTDDPDRVGAQVREAFVSHGGHLGADGAVAYLFNPVGLIRYPPGTGVQKLEDIAFQAGAEDVVAHDDGSVDVVTDPVEVETIRVQLTRAGLTPEEIEVTQRAAASTEITGDTARSMVRLLDALEEIHDVQNVYSNAAIPSEVLASV